MFISAEDFGVEPELLTTAQKVAILESQAFQNKNFNPILPPTGKSKNSSSNGLTRTGSEKSSGGSLGKTDAGSYVPSGLRMNTETLDAQAQDITQVLPCSKHISLTAPTL